MGAEENIWIYEQVVTEAGEDYVMRSFVTCMLHQILLGR
jgi:hypothetical protein